MGTHGLICSHPASFLAEITFFNSETPIIKLSNHQITKLFVESSFNSGIPINTLFITFVILKKYYGNNFELH